MPKVPVEYTVRIDKLIHGGQGIGTLENGQKALVWGALPAEKVTFISTKKRKDFVEGIVSKVIEPSQYRVEPKDKYYLSSSPWQILSEEIEDDNKKTILTVTLTRSGITDIPETKSIKTDKFYGYRNKMEYSFFGDEDGLHLALYNRGTHKKQPLNGSSIAMPEIDIVAGQILKVLQKNEVRAGDLKTLILRASQDGNVAAALFVKNQKFPEIQELEDICKGIVVVYSNPKSPASVRTEDLYMFGDTSLRDMALNQLIRYDVFSFFQVNVPVFNEALNSISRMLKNYQATDMYSGVGSIGIALPSVKSLVESDSANIKWAKINAADSGKKVIHSKSESALDNISGNEAIILDPPRAGLHIDLINRLLMIKPPKIIYLSCNPSTQARDIDLLKDAYLVEEIESYNFFPRTPHIESLVHLVRR